MHFNSFNHIKMKLNLCFRVLLCQCLHLLAKSWIRGFAHARPYHLRKIGQTSGAILVGAIAFSSNYAVVDNKCANNNKSITHEKHVVRERFFDFIIFVIAFMMMFCCSHHAVADFGIVRKNGNAPFACALRNSVLSVHVEY